MEISSEVAALFGVFIGGLVSVITTFINVKGNTDAQIKLENLKRENALKDFQRENLLKLQRDIKQINTLVREMLLTKVYRRIKTDLWTNISLEDNGDHQLEVLKVLKTDISIAKHQLVNKDLRNTIDAGIKQLLTVLGAENKEEASDLLSQFRKQFLSTIITEIGKEIRKTY